MIYYYEDKDFHWTDIPNGHGFVHTLPVIDGKNLRRVYSPSKDSVVYRYDNLLKCLIPALVTDGRYEVDGRISNFWYWHDLNKDLTLKEKQSGYGGFYQSPNEFEVKQTYSVTIK